MEIHWSLPGYSRGGEINEEVLSTPLPSTRHFKESPITYGHYVDGVTSLLKSQSFQGKLLKEMASEGSLLRAEVSILKHGHFYHPAKMEVESSSGAKALFVLNLAATQGAMAHLETEFALFQALSHQSESLPLMFGVEDLSHGGEAMKAMVGQWLDGYWEFHQSGEKEEVVVWADSGHLCLEASQAETLYMQAAEILTTLYNPLTFEAVQPWHHAAGDFVVKLSGGAPEVKLITLRQYTPLFVLDEVAPEDYLEGALIFFMLLSIRNRMDRYDGIGDVAWVNEGGLRASLEGFLKGLKIHENVGPFEGAFSDWVRIYLKKQDADDLFECALSVLSSLNPDAKEVAVIRQEIKAHVEALARLIKGLP